MRKRFYAEMLEPHLNLSLAEQAAAIGSSEGTVSALRREWEARGVDFSESRRANFQRGRARMRDRYTIDMLQPLLGLTMAEQADALECGRAVVKRLRREHRASLGKDDDR